MTSRREFLGRIAGHGSAALVLAAARVSGQQRQQPIMHDSSKVVVRDSTNLFAMDQSAARPVRLPPKPNAVPLLNKEQLNDLERRIHCQCGCTLDVYTCRTTDFSCAVSPAMHRDVLELVRGGYSAQEILDAFVNTYGETARMAPTKSGFNLIGWFAPATAVVIGAGALVILMRRWRPAAAPARAAGSAPPAAVPGVDATPAELARLEAAVRGEPDE
jgi:cytochrome c-type biogenesis protein CcmH